MENDAQNLEDMPPAPDATAPGTQPPSTVTSPQPVAPQPQFASPQAVPQAVPPQAVDPQVAQGQMGASLPATGTQPVLPTQPGGQLMYPQGGQLMYQQVAAPPAIPAGPQSFSTGVKAVWELIRDIFGGRSVAALGKAETYKWFWPVSLGSLALLSAFIPLIMALKASSGINSIVDDFGREFGFGSFNSRTDIGGYGSVADIGASASFKVFFMVLFGMLIFLCFRVLQVKFTLMIRKSPMPFAAAASIVAVAYLPMLYLIALAFLLLLILPARVFALLTLLLLPLAGLAILLAELAIYIGMNRRGPFSKSILIPHVWMTGAYVAAVGFVSMLVLLSDSSLS